MDKIELNNDLEMTEETAPINLNDYLFGDDSQPGPDEGEEEKVKQMLENLDEPEGEEEDDAEPEDDQEGEEPEDLDGSENDEPEGVQNHDDDNVPKKAMLAERKKWQKRLEERDPYYKLGKAFADQSNLTPDQVAEKIDEIIAKDYASKNGMPIEEARREIAAESKERDLKRREAVLGLKSEAEGLKNSTVYSLLSDQEVRDEVVDFAAMKGLSVKQAYRALYEDSYMANSKRSRKPNRKKASTSAKPEGSKNGTRRALTPDEATVAKLCGMSEEEWIKWSR